MIKRVIGYTNQVCFHLKLWQEKWQAFTDAEDQKYYADPEGYKRKMSNLAIVCGMGFLLIFVLFGVLFGGN